MCSEKRTTRRAAWPGLLVLAALLACLAGPVAAQQAFAFSGEPRTGDRVLDARVADINRYGDRYREAFVDELVRYHAAPRALVGALLADERWAPGDLYLACALARAAGRPCRHVIQHWRKAHAAGWGETATALGIAPGSPAFRRVAEGVEASYARWGRPLPAVPDGGADDAGPADAE